MARLILVSIPRELLSTGKLRTILSENGFSLEDVEVAYNTIVQLVERSGFVTFSNEHDIYSESIINFLYNMSVVMVSRYENNNSHMSRNVIIVNVMFKAYSCDILAGLLITADQWTLENLKSRAKELITCSNQLKERVKV